MNTTQKFDFAAPFVPAASPEDGLIRNVDLGEFLAVEATAWTGMRPGFYLQLMLNTEPVGEVWTMSDIYQPGDIIPLRLNTRHLAQEGRYELGLRATNNFSEVSERSPTTPLLIDHTPPGAPLMGPIMFAQASFGDTLKGRIPSYSGQATGDYIQTVCNGSSGPAHRVRPENLSTTPIEISFTKELMEGLFSDKVSITYHVTDRAGNRSILAQPVELTVQR